jgi:hypothetical protein
MMAVQADAGHVSRKLSSVHTSTVPSRWERSHALVKAVAVTPMMLACANYLLCANDLE